MIDQGIGVVEANNADMLMGLSLQALLGLASPTLLSGLSISNSAGDPVNDVDFSSGVTRDSTNTVTLIASTAMTKQLDAAWAAGSGAGGRMSAAAIANTTYHCFAILNDSDSSVDFGFDVSPTAPTMPTGYTFFRRVGTIIRVAGALLLFSQNGDEFLLSTPVQDVAVGNPGIVAVTRTLVSLPTGLKFDALINIVINDTAGANNWAGIVTSLDVADVAPTAVGPCDVCMTNTGTSNRAAMVKRVRMNTAAQVRSRVNVSDANKSLYIYSLGWYDTRDK